MASLCGDISFEYYLGTSWYDMEEFCAEEGDAVLESHPNLKIMFDTFERERRNPDSMLSRMLQTPPLRGKKIRLFFHTNRLSETADCKHIGSIMSFYSGIHLYQPNSIVNGERMSISIAVRGAIMHELWHKIIYEAKGERGYDLADLIQLDPDPYWQDPNEREGAFEETVAVVLGVVAWGGRITYLGDAALDIDFSGQVVHDATVPDGEYAWKAVAHFRHDSASSTVVRDFDCLMPFIASHPEAWMAIARTVLKYGPEMDLDEFVYLFVKEHPQARSALPRACF